MNMSKLNALMGKPQTFKVGDIELELKPLTVDELNLFSFDQSMPVEKQTEMTKELIKKVLKKSVPDATDEEIDNISLEHLEELMNAIMKLHKFSTDDGKMQKMKDAISQRKQATAAQATNTE